MTPNPNELTIDNSVLLCIDHQADDVLAHVPAGLVEAASSLPAPVQAGSR
jgi:hypothetical protein